MSLFERMRSAQIDWRELWAAQYNAPTAKERIAARKLVDTERGRLANLGGSHLLNWTLENKVMPEIDDNVPMPENTGTGWGEYPETPPQAAQEAHQDAPAPKRRGRKPKEPGAAPTPRKRASAKQPSQAEALERALAFVSHASKGDLIEAAAFVNLTNNMAVVYNGQIAAGHPIEETLNLAPNLEKLRAALARTGKTLVLTETENDGLIIQGERLRVAVPCLQAQSLVGMVADAPAITGDFDVLKEAFKACTILTSENGQRVIEASVLLQANTCTGTNGIALIQYWHGLTQLPPDLVLPKTFCDAVSSSPLKIVGLGGEWDAEASIMKSFTVHFENGAWYKTQTYFDRWPAIDHVINLPSTQVELPPTFAEGIEAVSQFLDDSKAVDLGVGTISTRDESAVYEVDGLTACKTLNAELLKKLLPYMKTVDFNTHERQIMFFGDNVRGTLMGMT